MNPVLASRPGRVAANQAVVDVEPRQASLFFWQNASWRHRWFRRFWIMALVMLVLNLGQNLGLGNFNPLERSLFLMAMLLFVWGRPLRVAGVVGVGLMVSAILISAAFTSFGPFEPRRAAMALVALMSMLGFLTVRAREDEALFMLRSISLLPLGMMALGLLFYATLGRPLMNSDHTGALRLGGVTGPAFLAATCYAATAAAGFLFCRRPSWLDAALVTAALSISALSGTRMASACAGATALLCLLLSRKSGVFKLLVMLYGAAAVGIFLLTVGDQLVLRFLSGSSSGRDMIAGYLNAAAIEHPWFGVGFGHHGLLIPELVQRYTGTSAAHNELLRLLLELGWPGVLLFGAGWLLMWSVYLSRYLLPTLVFLGLMTVFTLYSTTDNTLFFVACLLGLIAIGLGMQLVLDERARAAVSGPVAASRWGR